ncbi:MAG: hypothetical protein AB7O52_01040 [Planctomycetota bacterium]
MNRELAAFALSSCLAVFAPIGCSQRAAAPVTEPEPEMTEAEKKASRDAARLAQLDTRLSKARERIRAKVQIEDLLGELEALRASAVGTPFEAEAQKLIDAEKARFAEFAEAEFEKLLPEVDRFIAAGEFYDADNLLETFDYDRFAEGVMGEQPVIKRFKEKRAEIRLHSEATTAAATLRDRARKFHQEGDLVRAIAVLETFPNRFERTSHFKEIRQQIKEYLSEYKAEKVKETEKLAIEWVDLDPYGLVPHGADGIFTEITGGWQGENNTEGNAQIAGGEDGWLDWFLEFDAKVPDGQELSVGIRFRPDNRTNQKRYEVFSMPTGSDDWVRLRIEVQEAHARLIRVRGEQVELIEVVRLKFPSGGFAFNLKPGDSFSVRNFRHKVFKMEEGPGAGDGATTEDAGG